MLENKPSKIEDIKSHLYNREDKFAGRRFEGELHNVKYKVSDDWSEEKKIDQQKEDMKNKKSKVSIFKIFFIGAVIFFIAAIGLAFYKFSTGGVSVSNENIDINIIGNAFTKGGEELPLEIEIVNRNNASLELVNLIISYPSGASNDIADIVRLPRDSVGTINAGETVIRNIKVKLFGEEKSIRNVSIDLEYHPEGSNAIFTKEKEYPVTISSAPLSLFIEAPESATTNQVFSLEVKAMLNSSLPEGKPTVLEMSYPNNFIFESAIPEPVFNNSIWDLSSLDVTKPVTIQIKGRLLGQDGDEQVFHVYAGATNPNNQSKVNVVYNSLIHSMLIEKPFLEAKILVNGQDSPVYTASSGDSISAQVSWVNNLSTRITDAQIIVGLEGSILDKSSVDEVDGFYDSGKNQIIWDKNLVSELGSLEPGAKGSVNFKFKPISLIGISNSLKDPQITLNVSIKGRQPNLGSTFSDIDNFSKKIIKIVSDFQIASSANYSSGFLPPKAENETKYSVTWTLSNTSNVITGAQAKSILPVYVDWVGLLAGGNEKLSYNEVTREVIWNIGTVDSNVGFKSNREVSFVISLRPSLSQVESIPQLMKEISLSGQDSFAGVLVKNRYRAITTSLTNDPMFKSGDQRVVK